MFAVSLPRRCAALIAAYAIALQALLSAFALMPAEAEGLGWDLCSSFKAERSGAPRPHDVCGACLAGHCAPAAGAPPATMATFAWIAFAVAILPPVPPVSFGPHPSRDEPHSPRAPPRA